MRNHFGYFARDVPDDVKEAHDSRRLIEWIFNNCDPFSEKNSDQKDEVHGEAIKGKHADNANGKDTGKEEGVKEEGRPGQKEMAAETPSQYQGSEKEDSVTGDSSATQRSKQQLQQIKQFFTIMANFTKKMSQELQDEQENIAAGSKIDTDTASVEESDDR